jgi:hypothetical protein
MSNVNKVREGGLILGKQIRKDLLTLAGEQMGDPKEVWQDASIRLGAYLRALSDFYIAAALTGDIEPGVSKMSAIIVTQEGDENTED